MTVLMSGINMYAMALVMKVVLGWDLNFSIWVSSPPSLSMSSWEACAPPSSMRSCNSSSSGSVPCSAYPRSHRGRRLDQPQASNLHNVRSTQYIHLWSALGTLQRQSHGHALDWNRLRPRPRHQLRLLDHGLPRRPARPLRQNLRAAAWLRSSVRLSRCSCPSS